MATPSIGKIISDLSIPKSFFWKKPVLIGVFGLPCAGKTHVAQYLAGHHPFLLLTTDKLRLKYGFVSGPETLTTMSEIADRLLPQKISIIFDGIHPKVQDRAEVRILAERHAVSHRLIFVKAKIDVISQRLQERVKKPEDTITRGKFVITQDHFERIARYLEPPTEAETDVVIVDTTEDKLKEHLSEIDKWLESCYL